MLFPPGEKFDFTDDLRYRAYFFRTLVSTTKVAECFVFSPIFHMRMLIQCFEIVAAAPSSSQSLICLCEVI